MQNHGTNNGEIIGENFFLVAAYYKLLLETWSTLCEIKANSVMLHTARGGIEAQNVPGT